MATAFVFMNIDPGTETAVLKVLREVQEVKEAYFVYGVYDVVAKVQADKMFPIHTEHPELFSRFVAGVTSVELPELGKTCEL